MDSLVSTKKINKSISTISNLGFDLSLICIVRESTMEGVLFNFHDFNFLAILVWTKRMVKLLLMRRVVIGNAGRCITGLLASYP